MSESGGAVHRAVSLLLLSFTVACFRAGRTERLSPRWSADLPPLRLAGDTGTVDTIASGALHRSFVVRQHPWAVHVLDIDRSACWRPVATKGASGAIGRNRTSALVASMARGDTVPAGGVNADFFLFDPPGVPTGAHVHEGRVVAGPGARPVFAVDSGGQAWMGMLSVSGRATAGGDSLPITSWNRIAPAALAWMDTRYGSAVDTSTGAVRVRLSDDGLVQALDTTRVPTMIPSSGGVLVLGPRAPASLRERFVLAARSGRIHVNVRLMPFHPREAVGGFPILVRDSAEVPGLDSAGAASFAPVRHPRTIVGVAAGGRRLLFITVDGRQPGYSAGTTNRESAAIALALGATVAINLDGGGSTAMVVARSSGGATDYRVVNRPSDPQGERPVGNALVVVRDGRGC